MIKGKDSYKIRAEIVRSDVIKHSVLQRLLSFDGALETNSAEQRTGFLSLLNSRPRDDCAVLDSMDKWQEECLQKDSGLTPKPDATKSKIFRVESSHPKALDMMLPLAVTGSENVPTLFVENYFIRVSIIRRANKLARKMTDNTKAVALVNLLEVYRRIKDNCGDDDSTWKYQGTDCSTSLVVDGVDARDGFKKTMKIELDITFFFKQKSMSAGVAIKDGSPIDIKGSSNIDIRDVDNNEGLLSSLKIQDWLYFSELQVPSVNSKISVSIGRGDDLCSTLVGGNKARGSLCDIKGKLSSAQGTQQQRHQVTIRMSKTHIDLSVRIHTKASVAGITLKKINTEIVHLILTLDSAEMIVQPETMDEKNLLRCMCESSTKCPFDTQPSDTGDNTDSPVLLNAAVNTKGLKVRMKSPSHIMLNSKNIKAFINQFEGGLDSLLKSKVVLRALFQGSQIDTSGGCFDKLSQEVTSVSGYSVPLFMGLMRLDRVLGVRMSEALLESEPALVAIDEVENAMEGKPIKSKKKGMFSKAAKKVRQRLADMQEKIVALKAVTVPQDEEEDEESLMDGTSHGLGVDEDGELIRQIPYDNPLSIRLELDIDHMKLGHEQSLELPHVITNIAELLVSAGYETQIPGIKTTEVEE